MVLYSDVSSPLDRSKRFTLSSPGRPVHSDTVLGSMVASHNGSQKKLFRLHEPNHSYYKNSYVTIAFNVARPFCLMDVSQWLQNLNESVTKVQNVACICRNNSYNIYIAPPRVGWVKKKMIFWTVHEISRTFYFVNPLKFPLRPPLDGGSIFLGRNHPQVYSHMRAKFGHDRSSSLAAYT